MQVNRNLNFRAFLNRGQKRGNIQIIKRFYSDFALNKVIFIFKGHEGQIKQDNDGHIGFIFLNGPLNQSQNIAVDKALIHHHLHFTKQIILLMNLTSDDLQLSEKTEADQKIKFYLFGKLSPASGKASDYINSVNVIYALIRTR